MSSAPRTSSTPDRVRTDGFSAARSSRWLPGDRAAPPQLVDGALEDHLAAGGAGAGAEVDDVVGDRDRLGLVLDDQHGVALVAQLQQQVVHPLDVVRVQADGRLVEDVGDVGERRSRGAGSSWCAAPRRPRACPTAGRGRGTRARSARTSRGCAPAPRATARRTVPPDPQPLGQVADLHRAGVGDVDPLDPGRPGLRAQPGAVALGADGEGDRPLDEGPDVRLQRVDVLGEHRLLESSGSGPRR